MTRVPKRPTPSVRKWKTYWHHMFKARHVHPPGDKTLWLLAGMCAHGGPPETDEGNRVYFALSKLFVNSGQRSRASKSAELLAENILLLDRVIDCVEMYNKYIVPNGGKALDSGRYKLDQVIKVMLKVPEAEPYVKSFVQSPLRNPNAVFHPRTLENAKKRLKGVFGYDAGDHQDQLTNKVKIIE